MFRTRETIPEEDDWEATSHLKKNSEVPTRQEESIVEESESETTTLEPTEVMEVEEERASSEITAEPARRSLRENRGRAPARYGDWTNK